MNEHKNKPNKKDKRDYYFLVLLTQTLCFAAVTLLFFYVRGTSSSAKLGECYRHLLKEDFFTLELDSAAAVIKEYLTQNNSFAVFGSRVEPYNKSEAVTEAPSAYEKADNEKSTEPQTVEAIALNRQNREAVPLKLSYKKEEKLLFPLYEGRYTSYYGERTDPITEGSDYHMGVDIGADEGDSIRAAADGRVLSIGQDSRSGKYVFIDHGNDTVTFYCHCSEILVEKGDKVGRGDTVALVGSTGYSTGPHLHFEVRKNDVSVDPLPLIENAADNP